MIPDLTAASQYIRALTGSAATPSTFQVFDDNQEPGHEKNHYAARIIHGSLAERWRLLVDLNADRRGIFCTVNETDFKGRCAHNVVRVRALFVDCDGIMPSSWHLLPSMVVRSAHGPHAYWFVDDCPLDRFTGFQKRLVQHYGSDPKPVDLPRVLRLPGFWHQKHAPFQVELLEVTGIRYTTAQVLAGIAELPAPPPRQPVPYRPGGMDGARGAPDFRAIDVVGVFRDAGMLGREIKPGKWTVVCPFVNEHSHADLSGMGSATVVFEGRFNADGQATFYCSHAHCTGRVLYAAMRQMGAEIPRVQRRQEVRT